MKRNNKHLVSLYTFLGIAFVVAILVFLPSEPSRKTGVIPGSNAADFTSDSTFRDNRQMGLVSLDKFLALASRLGPAIFTPEVNVHYQGDSVSITLNAQKSNIFFSDFTNIGQTERLQSNYHDFPVTILDRGTGFTAEVVKIDSTRYIRIPYLVLASLAEYVSGPLPVKAVRSTTDNTVNASVIDALRQLPPGSEKIQTEGLVMRNFSDIQAMKNKKRDTDPVVQLEIAWQYVKDNWLYIYDPTTADGADTWRSATETISNYYSNGKCYTGDCDDFAILMASFARQAGLESHLVGVSRGDGGHMFAEFRHKGEKKWHNLDWFEDFDSPNRYTGDREVIIDNI